MAIRFQSILPEPKQRVRTRSELAPLDCGIVEALPKIDMPLPKLDSNSGNANGVHSGNAKKRGRPSTGMALTAAEKQRRYRERKRAAAS